MNNELKNKKRSTKYLDYYYKVLRSKKGLPRQNGLCGENGVGNTKLFRLVKPTMKDRIELQANDGYVARIWWGVERRSLSNSKIMPGRPFTKIRQNIVLLMAALNNEL